MKLQLLVLRIRKLSALCRSGRAKDVISGGPAPSVEHDFLRRLKIGTVIDAGANIGQFASWTQWRFPQARIVSFEPFPEAATKYRQHVSGPLVTLHEFALGAEESVQTLHIAGSDDSSSLLEIGELQTTLYPSTKEIATTQVSVERLDQVLSAADLVGSTLLKIDVQGTELEVLRGAEGLLSEIEWVYVECSFVELYTGQARATVVIEFLASRGFDLEGVYNVSYDGGRAIQGDFLFTRAGK